MDAAVPAAEYTIATPSSSTGAIACVQVRTQTSLGMDAFLEHAAIGLPIGTPRLRHLLGIDEGLAIRWDETTLDLFPHGGTAIVRRLAAALESLGVRRSQTFVYPEAESEIDQRMLATLARAPSPLAVDLLLAQPDRWRAHTAGDPLADHDLLGRLLDPPLVAAVGPPNIGKSTLLNTLAGRSVAIVADEPGTTRDHVGATLDLGGLVVRYLDTPGRLLEASGIDAEAIAIADRAIATADLVLSCGDPSSRPIADLEVPAETLTVCLRRDLGTPDWNADLEVSALGEAGLTDFVRTIRDRLVPPGVLADDAPWRFWSEAQDDSDRAG